MVGRTVCGPYNVSMGPDDKICYCYGVPYRKLFNFAARNRLLKPSQMSECLGAGTGCGWCIPILKKIFEAAQSGHPLIRMDLTPEQYAEARRQYMQDKDRKNRFD